MDTMGRHIITELWECNPDKLNDIDYIERLFVDAALRSKHLIHILQQCQSHKRQRKNEELP